MKSVGPDGKTAISIGEKYGVEAPKNFNPVLHTHPRGQQFTPSSVDWEAAFMRWEQNPGHAVIEGIVSEDGILYYGFDTRGNVIEVFLQYKGPR